MAASIPETSERYFELHGGNLVGIAEVYADRYYDAEEAGIDFLAKHGAVGFVNFMGYRTMMIHGEPAKGLKALRDNLYIPDMATEAGVNIARDMYDPAHPYPNTSTLAVAMGLLPYASDGTRQMHPRIEEYLGKFVVAVPHAVWNNAGRVFQLKLDSGATEISEAEYFRLRESAQSLVAVVQKPAAEMVPQARQTAAARP